MFEIMDNLTDRNIASIYQYPNALDELRSQVAPEQFAYIVSVLSTADLSKPSSTEVDIDDDFTNASASHGSTWSINSRPITSESTERRAKYKDNEIFRNEIVAYHQDKKEDLNKFSRSHLALPLSKEYQRSGLLKVSSFESTPTTAKSGGGRSSISLLGVTSKDSWFPLKSVSAFEQSLASNVHLAEMKYSQMRFPMVEFQGVKLEANKLIHQISDACCYQLPVCKKIMGKYMLGRHSRSSSVESVKAETLPDLDSPLINIAGKIANEPVNQFPILKMIPFKKYSSILPPASKSGRKMASKLYTQRIEQDIDMELDTFQDYTDVSEFFTQSKYARRSRHHQHSKGSRSSSVGISGLSRRVTNPLYKVYDPTGYHKSEDELALECMQMICDDFNKWIQTISKTKRENIKDENERGTDDAEAMNESQDCVQHGLQVIDPEFLIQILRKDLELPEK